MCLSLFVNGVIRTPSDAFHIGILISEFKSRIQIGLAISRHHLQQLPGQHLIRRRSNLPTLARHAGGHRQYFPGHPVSAAIDFGIDLAGDREALYVQFHEEDVISQRPESHVRSRSIGSSVVIQHGHNHYHRHHRQKPVSRNRAPNQLVFIHYERMINLIIMLSFFTVYLPHGEIIRPCFGAKTNR